MKQVNIVTLGCSKNQVDAEILTKQLQLNGYQVSFDSGVNKEITIINTCGFILDAKNESVETVLAAIEAKNEGEISQIYVMGCLTEKYSKELEAELPEVDGFFGKFDTKKIISRLRLKYHDNEEYQRVLATPSHFAYLKISEGCDRTCAFCSIPQFTGKHISRSVSSLIDEAVSLAGQGVKELIIIAQDISYYGYDIDGKSHLSELLKGLVGIDGIEWIRLHYAYPNNFPLEVLDLMSVNDKICKYLDIPLQHASTSVLKKMRRGIDLEQTKLLLEKIRAKVPNVTIRTTLMVGHPGEGEEEFAELLSFVQEQEFDRVGVFTYSHEEDTYGYVHYKDEVSVSEKVERKEAIMELQSGISYRKNQAKVGSVLKVLIDRDEDGLYIGRTEGDSPEVDGEVLIVKDKSLTLGAFYDVKIVDAEEFDLFGAISS
ncbi:MAG: 30S ribosomal protein S12 methylthiotransferase RimO [Bacteroidales bacterium]